MPTKRSQKSNGPPAPALPQFRRIELARVLEPEVPARATMNDVLLDQLINSMRVLGQIEPISVEQHEAMYKIITGHRRFLAARSLNWKEIAALVYPEGRVNRWAMMSHENRMREDLNPGEEAIWMAQAREELGLDEAGLCELFHCSPDYLAGRFALLRGDAEVFACVQRGEIRLGVAHELNRITEEGMRRYYLDCARRGDPPQRVVHQWVNDWLRQEAGRQALLAAGALAGGTVPGAAATTPAVDGGDGAAGYSAAVAPAPFFGCEICGGDRDPQNLVNVRMHMWEWQQIQAQIERARKGAEG
jgi:ParB/RepB/Spo0J family partition protein